MERKFKFTEELLQAASKLHIQAKTNIGALLTGNYRSIFRGSGMQFKEFRHYEPGDDIRHMSWTVTARTGRPTIKVHEEERELDVLLLVDVSGSSLFGLSPKRRINVYAELVALIGVAAIQSGDNIGMLPFSDKPGEFLPPKRTRNQVLNCIAHILSEPLSGKRSEIRESLDYLQKVLKNRTLIIIISDFMFPAFENELMRLSNRHELILLHCHSDIERGVKLSGVHEVWDPEHGDFLLLDGNSPRTRSMLARRHSDLAESLQTISQKTNADYLSLSLENDYVQQLVHFFRNRGPAHL